MQWKKGFMAATNPITGKEIKTAPQNSAYAEGWERIFAKKSANEWVKSTPYIIMDPDGWRQDDGVTLDTPITWKEFQTRLNMSTVIGNI